MRKVLCLFFIILCMLFVNNSIKAETNNDVTNIYWAIDGENCDQYDASCTLIISSKEIPGNHFAQNGRLWWSSYNASITEIIIGGANDIVRPASTSLWFNGMPNIETIDFTYLDTSNVTNMSDMFSESSSLTTLDLRGFDTSNVSNMSSMFSGDSNLTTLDLSNFNTSKVRNMSNMFSECSKLTSLDLGTFDTSNVSDMSGMFFGDSSLVSLDISNFVINGGSMSDMFSGCSSLISLELSDSVIHSNNMSKMFSGCSSLISLDLSNFDTSNVSDMSKMFSGCSSLTSLDLSGFDITHVSDMSSMFSGCNSLISLNLHGLNSKKADMNVDHIFDGLNSLKRIKTPEHFTEILIPLPQIFKDENDNFYEYLNECPINTWLDSYNAAIFDIGENINNKLKQINANVAEITRSYTLPNNFSPQEYNILSIGNTLSPIYAWSEGQIIYYYSKAETIYLNSNSSMMFASLKKLRTIDLSNINTSKVTNMSKMFSGCSSLTSLDLSKFDTSNVTDMTEMFSRCGNLTLLNLSAFDTSKVLYIGNMFEYCEKLEVILVSKLWNILSVTNGDYMFDHCESIIGQNGTVYNYNFTDYRYANIDMADKPGYLSSSLQIVSLNIVENSISINKGDSRNIIVDIYPQLLANEKLNWHSSDEGVAIVDLNGKVTAVERGEAIITAMATNGKSVECEIIVRDPKILSIITDKDSYSVNIDDGIFDVNYNIETQDNPEYQVGLISSNTDILTIVNGKVIIMNPGEAEITIRAGDVEKKISVSVYSLIKEIKLNNEKVDLLLNQTHKLIATIVPENAVGDRILTWTSSDEKVATVDQSGNVTAVGFGKALITVKSKNNIEVSCNVFVDSVISSPTIAISANNDALTINWEEKPNATSYEIYRNTDKSGKFTKIAVVATNSYTNFGLPYGKTYYYKIIAKNDIYKTGYSNLVYRKVTPNKVDNLKVVSASTNYIKLEWDKVSVTGYEVYMGTKTSNMKKIKTITKNSTLTYKKSSLKSNKKYYFKVRAYKTVSGKKVYGSWSDIVSTKTAPVKPKISLSLKDYNALNLNISKVSGATKYIVENGLDGKVYTLVEELPSEGKLAQDDLETGKTYYYRVRACNSDNRCSGWVTASKKVTPLAPKLTLSTSSKTVTITLTSVNGVDGYKLYRATKKTGKYSLIKEFTTEDELLEYVDSTKKGTTYYYKVRSYKVVNETKVYSSYSSIKSIRSK